MLIPEWLRRFLVRRMVERVPARRAPDVVIGGEDHPYLRRWWVIPRNRWFNIYLHEFLRSDDDRALHDHPWASLSIIIDGPGYTEVVSIGDPRDPATHRQLFRPRGSLVFRPRAAHAHRIALVADHDGELPVWTLFLTGPVRRRWGFWCPQGWRHWREFTDARGTGIGRGCE